jgi:hypothetical protein
MWLFIRKWWFLQQLRKKINLHTSKASLKDISLGSSVLLTVPFFITGTTEYPGLAFKSVRRFSSILRWRKKADENKLKKRIHEYNSMLNSLLADDYIMEVTGSDGNKYPSVATPKADGIHGLFGLVQAILEKYNLAWTFIVLPLITLTVGIKWETILHFVRSNLLR